MAADINLLTIARINERIKLVMLSSHHVYMIALNAMFLSRKTTEGVAGFASVTTQLRSFSTKLNERMDGLQHQLAQFIGIMGTYAKIKRLKSIIDRLEDCPEAVALIRDMGAKIGQLEDDLDMRTQLLLKELDRVLLLVGMGQNLAVLAKVEANGTGDLSAVLSGIAEEMDSAIVQIEQFVHASKFQLAA